MTSWASKSATPGRRVRAAALFALLVSLGCRRAPHVLTIAQEAEPSSLDPAAATGSIEKSILSNVYDTLVDGDVVQHPALAVSWKNPDSLTWIFELRPGVRTHDGRLLTAHDVRASIDRARGDPASRVRDRLATVQEVAVIGPSTVRIRTRDPDPLLLYRLSDIFIISRFDESDPEHDLGGTGPYRMVGRRDGFVELAPFPGHWRGAPKWPHVRFTTLHPGRDTARALREGRADVVRFVPESMIDEVRRIRGVRVVERAGVRGLYLWMNSTSAGEANPLSDKRVRRAISLAIDRKELVRRLGGHATPLSTIIPQGLLGHRDPIGVRAYDPDASRRLLAESGFPDGVALALVHTPGGENIADTLKTMLGRVGIRLTPSPRPWPSMLSDWQAAKASFFMGSWTFTYGDASMFLKECLSTRDPRASSGWNPGYSNPALDDMIAARFRTFDTAARDEQFAEIARVLEDDTPLIPLVIRNDIYAVRDGVSFHPRLDTLMRAEEMGER